MNWSAEDAQTCAEQSKERQKRPDTCSVERRKLRVISELKGSYKKTNEYHSLENLHWWLRTALHMKVKSLCSGQLPSCLGWLVGFWLMSLFFHRNLGKDNFFIQEQFNSLAQQYKVSSENRIAEALGAFLLSWFCGLKNMLHLKRKH